MIKIKFTGHHGERELDGYVWNEANGWVQEVDPETAANLLTYPIPDQFALIAGQKLSKADKEALDKHLGAEVEVPEAPAVVVPPPTLADVSGLSQERQAQLAEAGIPDLAALASLDEAAVKAAANKTGATRKEISGWVSQAKDLLSK